MRAHGDYQIWLLEGRILWNVVRGGINETFSQQYKEAMQAQVEAMGPGPWIRVSDIRLWELGGPEVIGPLHEWMQWCEDHELSDSINLVSMPGLQTHLLDLMMQGVTRHSVRHLTHNLSETMALLARLRPGLDLTAALAGIYSSEMLARG